MPRLRSTSPRKPLRARLIPGCLWILLLVVLSLAFLLSPSQGPPPLDPVKQEQSRVHIADIKREIESVAAAAKEKKRRPFTFRITQDDLNTFLTTDEHALKIMGDKEIEQAYARIAEGHVEATAIRRVGGLPVSVTATLSPVLKDDKTLGFKIEHIALGRLGLPEAAARRVAGDLAGALTQQAVGSMKYHTARIEADAIVLSGDTR